MSKGFAKLFGKSKLESHKVKVVKIWERLWLVSLPVYVQVLVYYVDLFEL